MRFSLRRCCSLLLRDWEQSDCFAADLVDKAASKFRLDSRDRAALQRLMYAVIRNQRLLDHVIDSLVRDRPDPLSRRLLRIGLADLLLLEAPPHAVVHETVGLAGRTKPMVNAVLRRATREGELIRSAWTTLPPEIRWSVPSILWQRWREQFGPDHSLQLAIWNQQPSSVYLRLNAPPQKTLDLAAADVVPIERFPAYVRLNGSLPREWLESGCAYAQDPSTQPAVAQLDLRPGCTVLDACAAPGGKTLAIIQAAADLQVWATDQSEERLAQLTGNLRRLRLDQAVEVGLQNWLEPISPKLANQRFDRILIDAPCSNTGVIRRRIDVPWRLQKSDFAKHQQTQLALLTNLVPRLAVGGRIVYSTCSLDREENEAVTEAFLKSHPALRLVSETRILPWIDGFDGAYSAAFITMTPH